MQHFPCGFLSALRRQTETFSSEKLFLSFFSSESSALRERKREVVTYFIGAKNPDEIFHV